MNEMASDIGTEPSSWDFREDKFNRDVAGTLEYYTNKLNNTWKQQRLISLIVMLCSVFAPLLVVGSSLDQAFYMSDVAIKIAAVIVTIILSIAEGLKRIFRFERRWVAIYWARSAIKRARNDYRIAQIGQPIGSETWVANFKAFRDRYYETIDAETHEFFDALGKGDEKAGPK